MSERRRRLGAGTPLRVRLVLTLLALVALALVLTGAVATTQLRGYLVDRVDRDLASVGVPRAGPAPLRAPVDRALRRSRAEWYVVTDLRGRRLSTPPQVAVSPPRISRAQIVTADSRPRTVPSQRGGSDWRVSVAPVRVRGSSLLVVRAISLADVDATVRRLLVLETLVGVLVLALLGAAGYVVVRRSLRPLVDVEHTAAAIASGDLTRRVPEGDPGTEVGRLSRALNGMLAQIESAFRARETSEAAARASEDRMRRFVADASHELRTPLTSIRGFAELYRQGAASGPADVARVLRRVEDAAARMGVLVDDLLLLARLDQQRPLERAPVDLVALAADAVHDARTLAPDRAITLDVATGDPAVVLGDESRLRQVLGNLLANALGHTPAASPVELSVTVRAPGSPERDVRVAVRDEGPGLPPQQASRVFERFYRADPARTRAAGGTGLGLSIVESLVAAHGGQVGVDSVPGQGATFWVRLPLAGGADPPAGSQRAHRSVTGT